MVSLPVKLPVCDRNVLFHRSVKAASKYPRITSGVQKVPSESDLLITLIAAASVQRWQELNNLISNGKGHIKHLQSHTERVSHIFVSWWNM